MTDTPTVQTTALRVAVLTTLRDLIDADLGTSRAEVLDEMEDLHAAVGVKSLDVTLPGYGKVASITVTLPEGKPAIEDDEAFGKWMAGAYPSEVETIHAVKPEHLAEVAALHPEWVTTIQRPLPTFTKTFVESLVADYDEAGAVLAFDPTTGELVPGVTIRTPRRSSITLRMDGGAKGAGRQAIAAAWREGRLSEVPAITQTPSGA